LVVNIAGQEIFCTHDPAAFNSAFKINLVGHVHDAWLIQKRDASLLVNMSVDVWKYSPVNINEILHVISKQQNGSES
jgi:calcineurin-like phosphoesterase family protein